MARVRAYRMWYLFLTVPLVLLGFNLFGGEIHARTLSRDGRSESARERVQRFLSDQQIEDSDAIGLIFKEDDSALPILLTALREGRNMERASWALASLGGPKEREILLRVIATEKDHEKKWLMSSFLAGALVAPSSNQEWHFLETCLEGYKEENAAQENAALASFSAAVALGINGSPRALQLLRTAAPSNQTPNSDNDTAQVIRDAIRWIKERANSNKQTIPAETKSDSEQIKQVVLGNAFYAEGQLDSLSVEDIAFTRDKARALVTVEVRGPTDVLGYDLVLDRRSGVWKITGVWVSWAGGLRKSGS